MLSCAQTTGSIFICFESTFTPNIGVSFTGKNDSQKLDDSSEQLALTYNHGAIQVTSGNLTRDLRIEPDLAQMMSETNNEHILKWAWYAFRNNLTHKMRAPYLEIRNLQNKYAKLNGENVAQKWIDDYDMSLRDYKSLIRRVANNVMPLYQKLHAYVKFKLSEKYAYLRNWTYIPAHLLRNMWAQEWSQLIDICMPFNEFPVDVTETLKKRFNGNLTALVKVSELDSELHVLLEVKILLDRNMPFLLYQRQNYKTDWFQ